MPSAAIPIFLMVALAVPPAERRISLDVVDADIHDVVRLLGEAGRVNVVIPDEVKGRVTVALKDVPWPQALAVVLASKGLGQQRTGDVIEIDTLERIVARTRTEAAIGEAREGSGELLTVLIPLRYARAAEMAPLVRALLTPRGRVEVDARTNVLIVTDVAYSAERIRRSLGI